jgi:hypothetical protein
MAVVDQEHRAQRYISEIERNILRLFPESRFRITPIPDDDDGIAIWTYSTAESEEIRDIVGERELQILLDEDIEILTIAMPAEAWED